MWTIRIVLTAVLGGIVFLLRFLAALHGEGALRPKHSLHVHPGLDVEKRGAFVPNKRLDRLEFADNTGLQNGSSCWAFAWPYFWSRLTPRKILKAEGGTSMQDVIFIAVTVAFFVLSIAYVRFCERVK